MGDRTREAMNNRAAEIMLRFIEAQNMPCSTRDQVFERSMKLGECFREIDEWAFEYEQQKKSDQEDALERMAENARELGLDY